MTAPVCRDMCQFPIHSKCGFTLVEMIVVMAIAGIVAATVAIFIRRPVEAYIDSAARAELTDVADTALRRMARDIRLALPNSVRLTDNGGRTYIEFLLTKTGGRYLSDDDDVTGIPILTWQATTPPAAANTFAAVVPASVFPQRTIVPNVDQIVVNNLGPGLDPANAYQTNVNSTNRATVTGANAVGDLVTITMNTNPFINQATEMTSDGHRFNVISGPVTYECDPVPGAGTLTRYSGYAIAAAQPNNPATAPLSGGLPALLARGVTDCDFTYDNNATLINRRVGIVGLSLTLTVPGSASGNVTLFHQVHVSNVP